MLLPNPLPCLTRVLLPGLIEDRGAAGTWKLLLGMQTMNGWTGPEYPNASTAKGDFGLTPAFFANCTTAAKIGCLFRVDQDPNEHDDLLAHAPNASVAAMAAGLYKHLQAHNATAFSPERGPGEAFAQTLLVPCKQAEKNGGFYGPFLELKPSSTQLLNC